LLVRVVTGSCCCATRRLSTTSHQIIRC